MKIGLFFGSFNPMHIGHLIIAQYILEEAGLDQIRIVVSPQNPFKDEHELWSPEKRLQLAKLSVGIHQKITVSDIEFTLPIPSYTIATLDYLSKTEPDNSFSIIMGSDNLQNFKLWKSYETILANYPILIYRRRGFENITFTHANAQIFDAPYLDISATFIRKRLNEGKAVNYLVRDEILPLLI